MIRLQFAAWFLSLALVQSPLFAVESAETNSPPQIFGAAARNIARIIEPPTNAAPRTFTATLKVINVQGLPKELAGHQLDLAFQAPDHLRLSADWQGQPITVCRDGQQLWVHEPAKKFGIIGMPGQPLFSSAPDQKDNTTLGPLKLPMSAGELQLLPLLADIQPLPDENVGDVDCRVFRATPKPDAVKNLRLLHFTIRLWVRTSDYLPMRLAYHDGKSTSLEVEVLNPQFSDPWPEQKWKLSDASGDKIESVALGHLTRFLDVAFGMMNERIPTLGPPTGEHKILAREGNGRLESIDGTRVLVLKGTPEKMGWQHGTLLKQDVRDLLKHIVYGVGVGSSFEKGRWFFGEIEAAQKRLDRHMDKRYLREMDALADASGAQREEVRLGNFFPELFHCSGFALFGKATTDGKMYHGRILDYMRGLGLEQHAVVMVFQPDRGNAWVNVSYAGFVGSVTAMNEKHLAIGEMGGRGEGKWDGKPMAELVREVMENANTLDEAIKIMRESPRTCEYYYVISDAKSHRAVGIAATPDKFETIWPGQSHPLLPHAIQDAVVLSAGDRYEELTRRVQANFGKFDAESARDLMKRPVCMTSNLHCALFEPETLDFWVANADSKNVAAHTRFTHYNLAELLQPEKPVTAAAK